MKIFDGIFCQECGGHPLCLPHPLLSCLKYWRREFDVIYFRLNSRGNRMHIFLCREYSVTAGVLGWSVFFCSVRTGQITKISARAGACA